MCNENGVRILLNEGGQPVLVSSGTPEPFQPKPKENDSFAVVVPFPVLHDNPNELVRPPIEYGTLVKHPQQPIAA